LLLALVVSGLSFVGTNLITQKQWTTNDTPQYNLAFSFATIVVMFLVIMLGVRGIQIYLAENSYASAMKVAANGNYEEAKTKLLAAMNYRGTAEMYPAALAQVYLLQARNLAGAEKPDWAEVNRLVGEAVNAARAAADISPRSVALQENLALMYENAASLVPEAGDWAIKSWLKAKELEPTNPVLSWHIGYNYAAQKKWPEAIKSYQEALSLKGDYIAAYVSLATAYEENGQINEAVEAYKAVMPYGVENADALFNYGRLLFNRNKAGDWDAVEKLWLLAVEKQPNHSNALFGLGMLYEKLGKKSKALDYYTEVRRLNPENQEILSKIRQLSGSLEAEAASNVKKK